MSTVYAKYRLYCITEAKNVITDWRTSPPTVCPHFMTDSIDTSTIVAISQFTQQTVNVSYNGVGTQGKWQALGFNVSAAAGASSTTLNLPPYPVKVSSLQILSPTNNAGDTLSLYTEPNTSAGSLSAVANIGDTVLNVTSTTTTNLFLGYQVSLGGTVVGLVTAINSSANTITISQALTSAYASGTAVQYSVPKISNLVLSNDVITIGGDNFTDVALPANSSMLVQYNNAGSTPKTLSLLLSVMY